MKYGNLSFLAAATLLTTASALVPSARSPRTTAFPSVRLSPAVKSPLFSLQSSSSSSYKEHSKKGRFLAVLRKLRAVGIHVPHTGYNNIRKIQENAFAVLAGLCLAFNSGCMNGCCLSGLLGNAPTGVSAFTGAYTNAGLALGAGNLGGCLAQVQMIGSFMLGSCLSGLMNPRPVPHRLTQRYGPSFLVGAVLTACASYSCHTYPGTRTFLYLAAMANGLQNAITSAYSANLIRSTHMSGTSSDIGMLLGQCLRGNLENLWRLVILVGLGSSFLLGGAAAWWTASKFHTLALTLNAGFFAVISLATILFTAQQERVSLWRAASGRWNWKDNAPPTEQKLKTLLDQQKTSEYTEAQFEQVMLEAGIQNMSPVGFQAVFRSADKDGDGLLQRDEMMALVQCDVVTGDCEIVTEDNNENEASNKQVVGVNGN